MNVLQVIAGISPSAGGTTEYVRGLCRVLCDEGLSVALHALSPAAGDPRGKYRVVAHESAAILSGLGASHGMLRALKAAARQAEICHTNGIWKMPNVYPAWAVRGTNCRLVVSPHGMLEPWSLRRSPLRKNLVWYLWQGKALRQAACFHVTAENEYRSIRALGFRQPVAIIPTGVHVPESISPRKTTGQSRRLLYLGRLHPKKGLDILIKAWRTAQNEFSDWELYVVGPDEGGYGAKMQELARRIGAERVFFPGPVWGEQRSAAYAQADLFVLPTHSENFGISVAEALAHGVPAIVSKGAPWAELETNQCGWWIDLGEEALVACFRSVLALPTHVLQQYGARGRDWVVRDFSWSSVGRMMHETYCWLVGGGPPPPFVWVK